ncbi:MAG: HIT family protein [Nanoarchaeota archaeon]
MPEQEMTPEQLQEFQEKIKNMNPEELKAFQKKQCIFCHIVSSKVQSKKIYEDDRCIAILDINPANPGHILLLPKEHYNIMPQLPDIELAHIFQVAKALSNACLRTLEAGGTNIIVANGVTAGQKANHFMVHIIPRRDNDGISFTLPQKKISEKDLNDVRSKLAKKIASLLGKKPPKERTRDTKKEPVPKVIEKPKAEPKKIEKNDKITNKPVKNSKVSLDDISELLKNG